MKFDINRLSKILELLYDKTIEFKVLYAEMNGVYSFYNFPETDEFNEDLQLLKEANLLFITIVNPSMTFLKLTKLGRDTHLSNNISNHLEKHITEKNLQEINSELDLKQKSLNIHHLEQVTKSYPCTQRLAWIGAATGILALIIEFFKSCN